MRMRIAGLIVAYRNGAGVRLSDVADVEDSVEDVRAVGLVNNKPAVLLLVFRETSANIVETVARVRAALPQLQASLPNDVQMVAGNDQSETIRSALGDTEVTLLIAVTLVVLVVFAFLRNVRTALIPTVAVPVSIIGTFAAMYLCGYTLDNLSLMALTISTGFVVDDAIVVLENVARHLEAGMRRAEAVLLGVREVAFTVVSISASLVAVFLPILLMQGIAGRLFREFAVTLVMAILISLVLSLTANPRDVFAAAATSRCAVARPSRACLDPRVRLVSAGVCRLAGVRPAASAAGAAVPGADGGGQRCAVLGGAEGAVSRSGHRPDARPDQGRRDRELFVVAGQAVARRDCAAGRSGGRRGPGLFRRPVRRQFDVDLRHPEAEGTPISGLRDTGTLAAETVGDRRGADGAAG